jgi:Tol biopolymer transport system component
VRSNITINIWKLDLNRLQQVLPAFPVQIVASRRMQTDPAVSPDGNKLAFESNRSGLREIWTKQIWKTHPSGGAAEQVKHTSGFAAVALPEGAFLYYAANRLVSTSLKRLNLKDGTESTITTGVVPREYFPTKDGIFFVTGRAYRDQSLQFYSSRTGKSELVARFDRPLSETIASSSDSSVLFYGQLDEDGGYLLYVENFWR